MKPFMVVLIIILAIGLAPLFLPQILRAPSLIFVSGGLTFVSIFQLINILLRYKNKARNDSYRPDKNNIIGSVIEKWLSTLVDKVNYSNKILKKVYNDRRKVHIEPEKEIPTTTEE